MEDTPLWKCGTCGCHIRQRNENPGDYPIFIKVEKKCPAHKDVPDDELFGVLLSNPDSECARASAIFRALLAVPELVFEDPKTGAVELKNQPVWREHFVGSGSDRKLEVTLDGVKPDELKMMEINGSLDQELGVGKATVK